MARMVDQLNDKAAKRRLQEELARDRADQSSERKRQAGNQPFVPTDEQRQRVEILVSCDIPQHDIAKLLGIGESTLQRHFRTELDEGRMRIHAAIAEKITSMALRGDRTMAIFYSKARMGWRDRTLVGLEDGQGNVVEPKLFSIQIGGGEADAEERRTPP
jgi:hypothetical protein